MMLFAQGEVRLQLLASLAFSAAASQTKASPQITGASSLPSPPQTDLPPASAAVAPHTRPAAPAPPLPSREPPAGLLLCSPARGQCSHGLAAPSAAHCRAQGGRGGGQQGFQGGREQPTQELGRLAIHCLKVSRCTLPQTPHWPRKSQAPAHPEAPWKPATLTAARWAGTLPPAPG